MSDNILLDKSFSFAIKVVNIFKELSKEHKEYVLSKQLLRSGTSIGAMAREAQHAESKADFIHKLSIGLKEANETEYWIDLLFHTNYIDSKTYKSLDSDIKEILRLLISIIKSSKTRK